MRFLLAGQIKDCIIKKEAPRKESPAPQGRVANFEVLPWAGSELFVWNKFLRPACYSCRRD
jgi:hypothetical protein